MSRSTSHKVSRSASQGPHSRSKYQGQCCVVPVSRKERLEGREVVIGIEDIRSVLETVNEYLRRGRRIAIDSSCCFL